MTLSPPNEHFSDSTMAVFKVLLFKGYYHFSKRLGNSLLAIYVLLFHFTPSSAEW